MVCLNVLTPDIYRLAGITVFFLPPYTREEKKERAGIEPRSTSSANNCSNLYSMAPKACRHYLGLTIRGNISNMSVQLRIYKKLSWQAKITRSQIWMNDSLRHGVFSFYLSSHSAVGSIRTQVVGTKAQCLPCHSHDHNGQNVLTNWLG